MKKKILSLFIAAAMTVPHAQAAPADAAAEVNLAAPEAAYSTQLAADDGAVSWGTYGPWSYCEFSDHIELTHYNENAVSVKIPAEIGGKPVTSIGSVFSPSVVMLFRPFEDCPSLTSVTIPKSLKTISSLAFSGCANLTNVNIPFGVETIGSGAFEYCSDLTSLNLPGSITHIGEQAFRECTSLTSMTIPDSVISAVSQSTFSGCTSLTSVSIGSSVPEILAYAFDGCTALTDVVLSGATNIGYSAFKDLPALTSVRLSDGITEIGDGAFSGCTALTGIKIPDSVTSIGEAVFSGCSSLAYVSIGSGITSLSQHMFEGCSSLNQVGLPDGLTSIGFETFKGCTGLTSLSLPDSVTDIGPGAFFECSGLVSMHLSNSLTSISHSAFMNCSSLRRITIPADVTIIYDNAFYRCDKLESVTMGNRVTTIGEIAFRDCSIKAIRIPASVNYIGYTAFDYHTTLEDIYYGGSLDQWNKIPSVSSYYSDPRYGGDGYYHFENVRLHFAGGSSSAGSGAPEDEEPRPDNKDSRIKSADIIRDGQPMSNLLTSVQTFKKGSNEEALITVFVETAEAGDKAPYSVVLKKGEKKAELHAIIDDTVWQGRISPGTVFDPGEYVYIELLSSDGKLLDSRRTFIRIEDSDSGKADIQFNLLDSFTFTVSGDKPVLGGMEISPELGSIKATIEYDADTFKCVIGPTFEKNEQGKFNIAEFNSWKKITNEAGEKIKQGQFVSVAYNALMKDSLAHFKFMPKIEKGLSVCGYVEGRMVDGRPVPTGGGIFVLGELEYLSENQLFIPVPPTVIPVYYCIGGGGEVAVSLDVMNVSETNFKPNFKGSFRFSPYFEIGGGLGVVYLAQAGVRGRATLNANFTLGHTYNKVDLTGEAFAELKALSFKLAELRFAHGTWTIYETGRGDGASTMSAPENMYASIDIYSPVTPEDRGYAASPSVWTGGVETAALMAESSIDETLSVIQTNAYPGAEPQITDINGTKVMVWLTDNTERDSYNKTMLVYSVYDGVSGWSEPQPILDDGTADYHPSLRDRYVVWMKANRNIKEGSTLAEIGQSCEIYAAEFDGSGFNAPVRLTDNDILDAQPHIAVDGENATVVWSQNSENNILGYTGRNAIYRADFNGSEWTEPVEVLSGQNTVTHLDAGYMNGELVIAYVMDADNQLGTIDDRELYLIRSGAAEQLTHNDALDSNPVFSKLNGQTALFWYSGGNIYYVTDLDEPICSTVSADGLRQLTDDYSIISNGDSSAVLWTSVQNGVSEIHGALYDGVQWSEDITITNTGQSARYPDGIIDGSGNLIICFNRIENVDNGYGYFEDGRADLCVFGLTPAYDVSVKDVFIAGDIEADDELPVYFTVVNSGELPINGISVDILGIYGEQNSHFDFEQPLRAGESIDLVGYYFVDGSIDAGDITVVVSTDSGFEQNLVNNEAYASIGCCDVEITSVSVENDGDIRKVTLTVRNSGITSAWGVTAFIQSGFANSKAAAGEYIGSLKAREEITVTFEIDANTLAAEGSVIPLTAAVTADNDEASIGNNYQGFIIDKGSNSPAAAPANDYVINRASAYDGVVEINVTGLSGTDGNIIAAAYSDDGRLIDAAYCDIALSENETEIIALNINTAGAARIMAFIWDDINSMRPLCEYTEITMK